MVFDGNTSQQSWFIWATQNFLWRITNHGPDPIQLQVKQTHPPVTVQGGDSPRYPLYPGSTMAVEAMMVAVDVLHNGSDPTVVGYAPFGPNPARARIEFEKL